MPIARQSSLNRSTPVRFLAPWWLAAFVVGLLSVQPAVAQGGAEIEDIIINEVFYSGGGGEDWVELKNIGNIAQDISTWWLCTRLDYATLSNLSVMAGPTDRVLDPGEILALRIDGGLGDLNDLDGTSADIGLYRLGSFGNFNDMADFVQYNTMADVGRSDVAAAKGIWLRVQDQPPLYDATLPAAPGESLSYCGDPEDGRLTLGSDFSSTEPTPGSENTSCVSNSIFADGFEDGDTTRWSSAS